MSGGGERSVAARAAEQSLGRRRSQNKRVTGDSSAWAGLAGA